VGSPSIKVILLMRTRWDTIDNGLVGPWSCLVVRLDFSAECARDRPVIGTAATPDPRLRDDEVLLRPADTTQARHLQIKVINKAVDTAYAAVFHVRRHGLDRISHVAWVKIRNRLCDMFHNLFAWDGYQEYLPVYILPFTLTPLQTLDVDRWVAAGAADRTASKHGLQASQVVQV
jgi:hypothetical protein